MTVAQLMIELLAKDPNADVVIGSKIPGEINDIQLVLGSGRVYLLARTGREGFRNWARYRWAAFRHWLGFSF
jgi:hypothetical protein